MPTVTSEKETNFIQVGQKCPPPILLAPRGFIVDNSHRKLWSRSDLAAPLEINKLRTKKSPAKRKKYIE